MKNLNTYNKAMTLVEVTVTLAITGMLTAAALGVAVNLSRSRRIDTNLASDRTAKAGLKEVMSSDIRHATHYRNTKTGFELRTRASLDDNTLQLQHIPATVTYGIGRIGDNDGIPDCLIRSQQTTSSRSGEKTLSSLVCTGISKTSLRTYDKTAAPADSATWLEMDRMMTVDIVFRDPARTKLTFTAGEP